MVKKTDSAHSEFNGGIYRGSVMHRRFAPSVHQFNYPFAMLVIDLDELNNLSELSASFSSSGFAPIRFNCNDYLNQLDKQFDEELAIVKSEDSASALKSRVISVVKRLAEQHSTQLSCFSQEPQASQGVQAPQTEAFDPDCIDKVLFAGQMRHFGFYFSPVNFYFCYQDGQARVMLAEVSNTPWNERHCYLVELSTTQMTDKDFLVSPFMGLDMQYRWRVLPPENKFSVSISNLDSGRQRLFEANMALKQQPFSKANLRSFAWRFPLMTFGIVARIYWQAFKIWRKKIPFLGKSALVSKNAEV
ncbi:DUF1365 domain-containing protein [Shewanella sp. WXL01]|uniref:DUF1365 domain-containing protein n=1 Tax=Shewanella sp. WXL01 TaxID=2709721 RepID=UPI0014383A96|nr:DUF1365 domain-containing protein [Shewanella sp. WXL01]NKF49820.1 DUF1365 domain-containing protein [Shewanella sp. WXL01]